MSIKKTRAQLVAESIAAFPSDTANILAVDHRAFNGNFIESSLNLLDPSDQEVESKVTFNQEIAAKSLDLVPQSPLAGHLIGRIEYNADDDTFTAYTDLIGTSLQIGSELRARIYNNTGGTLLNGILVSISGASGVGLTLTVDLLDASNLDSSLRAFGMITLEATDGNQTYAIRYGAVRDLDTSALPAGTVVYADPETPGSYTTTRPAAPNYAIRIGICIVSHPTEGVIGVDPIAFTGSDTSVNIEGTLNGVVVETPHVEFYEDAGNLFVEVTNESEPGKNLAFIIGGMRYLLDTTTGGGPNGGAFAQLTPGADAVTLFENFVYIWLNGVTPELKVSTLSTPDTLAPIGTVSVFNVTRTLTEGVYKWRRYNDAPDNGVDDGFNRWIADAIRDKLGTTYQSGIDGTPTVNSTPSVKLLTTAGVAMQAHRGTFTAQDGNSYSVYNDNANAVVYEEVTDLAAIVQTASGQSLAVNGAYYRLKVYGMNNSNSGGALASSDRLLVTRPLGYYGTAADALIDPSNYDVRPNDITTEGVLFPLYTLIIGRTGALGATWALVELQDNRTRLITGGGGGGASGSSGTDDKVRATSSDTTNSYLDDKIAVTGQLAKSVINPAANEQVQIDGSGITAKYKASATKIIAAGVLAIGTDRNIEVSPETGSADDLNEITGLELGQKVVIRASAGNSITVKHNDVSATIKILLQDDLDLVLDETHPIELLLVTANALVELYRKPSGGGGGGGPSQFRVGINLDLDTVSAPALMRGDLTSLDIYAESKLDANVTIVQARLDSTDVWTNITIGANFAATVANLLTWVNANTGAGVQWEFRLEATYNTGESGESSFLVQYEPA